MQQYATIGGGKIILFYFLIIFIKKFHNNLKSINILKNKYFEK